MPKFPIRDNVLSFKPYSPGLSIEEIKKRFNINRVIKLASNENPLGTSPIVQEAVARHASSVFRYTQSGTPRLTEAIATYFNINENFIVTGNGSDEVIDLLIRVCPEPKKHSVVVSLPSFSLYSMQTKLCGVELREVPLNRDFSFNWQGLTHAIDHTTALVFITMPDNPSGYCPTTKEVQDFIKKVPATCLVVVDEAYADFITDPACSSFIHEVKNIPNLVVLRTFSKSFGLAGLRLGFGVMHEKLATSMKSVRPPFSVNILAEEAGIAALSDTAFREATMETVFAGRTWLTSELIRLGCYVFPTQANFLMFTLPENQLISGKKVFETLLAQGMIIRPLESYGLPQSFRVTVGNKEENHIFIELLQGILTRG